MSNKKLLVNGCGLTFGNERIKAWPKILSAVGVPVIDLSGPAVSNQWILDRTVEYLFTHDDINSVVVQLTNIDKLDVSVDPQRVEDLVGPDSLRNFVWKDIWPSSGSREHVSKDMYFKYLYSPELITKELANKCKLLDFWCQQHNITCKIYQGYPIPWTNRDLTVAGSLIQNPESSWSQEYVQSPFYVTHDFALSNRVPCIEYFFYRARKVAEDFGIPVLDKLDNLCNHYKNKHAHNF